MKTLKMIQKITCLALAMILLMGMLPQGAQAASSDLSGVKKLDACLSSSAKYESLKIQKPGSSDTYTRKYYRTIRCDKNDVERILAYIQLLCDDYNYVIQDGDYIEYKGELAFSYGLAYKGKEKISGSLSSSEKQHIYICGTGTTSSVKVTVSYLKPIKLFSDHDKAETAWEKNSTPSSSGSNGSSGSSSGSSSSGSHNHSKGSSCLRCNGNGERTCTTCDGSGYKLRYHSTPNYSGNGAHHYTTQEDCTRCRGRGKITCSSCGGDGIYGA